MKNKFRYHQEIEPRALSTSLRCLSEIRLGKYSAPILLNIDLLDTQSTCRALLNQHCNEISLVSLEGSCLKVANKQIFYLAEVSVLPPARRETNSHDMMQNPRGASNLANLGVGIKSQK